LATLIDSAGLVWLTRGHPAAAERLHQLNPWCISVVTYMELAQGCHTEVLPITPGISQRAADLIDALALSHSLRLADALIGATALEHGLTLITANTKHFAALKGLQLEAFAP
jgi:predicted nucleic acid-binding protein